MPDVTTGDNSRKYCIHCRQYYIIAIEQEACPHRIKREYHAPDPSISELVCSQLSEILRAGGF